MKEIHTKKIPLLIVVLFVFAAVAGLRAGQAYAEEAYGDDAYYYMEYLQTNYPQRAVAYPNLDAASAWLKEQITVMGYEYAGQPFSVPSGENIINGENIIFSKSGASDRVIVVGAHYDSVLTNGTDDNATGVGLLLETANRLSGRQSLPYTVRFVLFSAEEPGCFGSQYYVDNLGTEDRQKIICMINLDTLGAGDYMYLYGGGLDESGQPVRTWVAEQALNAAVSLGLEMSFHPDVNGQYPVPVKHTASDQQAFDRAGIPYLYFEASNWNGGNHDNFYQTDNPAVENGKMMHVPAYETLSFYTETFGGRIYQHLKAYSTLLDYLLCNLVPDVGTVSYEYEERDETVWAVSDVRIRRDSSVASEVLSVLKEGQSVRRTGYHPEWCRVSYEDGAAYIKTEFLTEEKPEGASEAENEPETETDETETDETETDETETDETETDQEKIGEAESEEAETGEGMGSGTDEASSAAAQEPPKQTTVSGQQVITQVPETQKQDSVWGNQAVDSVLAWMEGNLSVRIAAIAGIAAAAVLLCLVIFLIQNRRK